VTHQASNASSKPRRAHKSAPGQEVLPFLMKRFQEEEVILVSRRAQLVVNAALRVRFFYPITLDATERARGGSALLDYKRFITVSIEECC
jgi:hypothetical protein